jgi:hypothetical protein
MRKPSVILAVIDCGTVLGHGGDKVVKHWKVFLGTIELARFSTPGDMQVGYRGEEEARRCAIDYAEKVANYLKVQLKMLLVDEDSSSSDTVLQLVKLGIKADQNAGD